MTNTGDSSCLMLIFFRHTIGWTYQAQDKKQRTLPCGKPKSGRNLISSKTSGRFTVHGIPYSEHSSFPVSIVNVFVAYQFYPLSSKCYMSVPARNLLTV